MTEARTEEQFGRSLAQREFYLDETSTHVNHASYGTVPRTVVQFQLNMIEERERNPEHWYRYFAQDNFIDASAKVAEFIGCRKENLVLVENADTGINAVVKSMSWNRGESILYTDHTYEGTCSLVEHMKETKDIDAVQMDIPMPIEDEVQVVNAYAKVLDNNPKIKLAIIDHITSVSAMQFPVEKLVGVCHKKGVLALIDGAQCPGQLSVDVEKLAADFYVGNFHKWLFSPRGCTFLWIHPNHHDTTYPLVASANIFNSNLQIRYADTATRDLISLLAAPKAIEFYQNLGGINVIVSYNRKLLEWATSMLSEAWNSTCLPIPTSMTAPCMLLVGLPDTEVTQTYLAETKGQKCTALMEKMYQTHRVYLAVSRVMGKLWCRVSANVNNCKEDYYKLRDAVLDVLNVQIRNDIDMNGVNGHGNGMNGHK